MKQSKIPVIPAKYLPLPDDELLNSNGIGWIWDIHKTMVSRYVKLGKIPSPDVRVKDGAIATRKHYWKLGNIRKFINEMQP